LNAIAIVFAIFKLTVHYERVGPRQGFLTLFVLFPLLSSSSDPISPSQNVTEHPELCVTRTQLLLTWPRHRRNNRRDRGRLVPQLLGWGPTM